jgi:hypothetical protein
VFALLRKDDVRHVMYESASCQAPCFFCFCSFRAVFEA